MDLTEYRNSAAEKARIADLMALIPDGGITALDIGARDGFISKLLVDHFSNVTALDLEIPTVDHPQIRCVKGDISDLPFQDASFSLVFCAEVLEHIPANLLPAACCELARVSKDYVLIGVPFKQDIRVGRTTCSSCGKVNPPWGHVNSFDEKKLAELFPRLSIVKKSFVGVSTSQTNRFSCTLMDWSGNPYGTYSQDEGCVHCGKDIGQPAARTLLQKFFTKLAFIGTCMQKPLIKPHGNWIHLLLRKTTSCEDSSKP